MFFFSSLDIQCPDIADPINGQIRFRGDKVSPFDYGTVAEYSCNDGLILLDPDTGLFLDTGLLSADAQVVRVCEGNSSSAIGIWTGLDYLCEGMLSELIQKNYYFLGIYM